MKKINLFNFTSVKGFNLNHNLRALLVMLLFTLSVGNAWASSSYKAKLTASSADEAKGKVYVATSETAYGDRTYAASSNATSEDIDNGATQTFYIYAEAVRGYKFTGWTKTDSKTHSIADASVAETTDGVVAQTQNGTTAYTIQASFVENTNKFNIRYLASTNGTYTVKGPTGYPSVTVPSGDIETYDNDNITLTATPASGYSIKRFFIQDANGIKETIGERGEKIQTVNIPDYAVAVGAEFKVASPFKVGDETYATLSDALQAVGTSGTIRVVEDATVAAGYYTIPAGVTLIVPRYAEQTEIEEHPERVYNAWTKPSPFRTLTLASGVHIDVYGTVFTASLMAAKGQTNGYNGMPHGKYGHIVMNAGSTMTLNNGSQLYCWGYITGAGTIDARRGSTTHEFIQLRDWRGGSATSYGTWNKVFPFNQYYIQNIEVPVTYRPGSLAKADGTVNASSAAQPFNDVNVIGVEGSESLFMMDANDDSEDTWVRKSYNKTTDQQIYEINSSAKLSSLVVYGISSSSYVLPITSNMKIHVLSGSMNITANTELLPGSEIEIDKEASCEVASGKSFYIFDSENWSGHSSGTYYVPYSPSWTTCPRSGVKDAQINVHGTVRANGTIYTTEKGANIFSSSDDAGTYYFAVAAPTGNSTVEYANGTNYTESTFRTSVTVNPAKLKNGNGSYTETVNTPAGKSFAYIEDEWKLYDVDPDNSCFIYDEEGTYYAKPKGYVAINATKSGTVISGNPDHTFSDKAGTGRLFILMDGCQWWEVVLSGDLYYCADNDIYYTYNTSTNKWEEKTYTILWKDWDGTTLTTYTGVKRGTMATYNSSNPTRANTLDEIYSFGGWSPAPATITGDATYTATYSCTTRKYTIQFLSDRGTEIDRQQLARGEIPALPEAPQKPGKYLVWDPTIAAVTGDQIYRATYLDNEPDEFTVTWHQYDGSEIYHETVSKDAIPNYDVATYGTPVKDLGNEYIYTFTGWSPVVAAATENVSYTAAFSAAKKTYTVTFRDENGNALGAAYGTGSYEIGQTPTSSYVPAQPNPEQYNYTFTWSPAIETVTEDAIYTAHLDRTTRKYTILANGINGTALGGGTHNYGVSIPLTAVPNDYYHFIKWQKNGVDVAAADGGTASPLEITITGDATYTAVAEANTFSVSFAAGAQGSGTMANQAFTCYVAQNLISNAFTGATKTLTYYYHGATAGNGTASASDSYTFANWLCTEDSRTYTNGQNVSNLTSTNGATYALTAQWTAPSVTLPTPTRIGYTFNGWYDAATGGTKVGDAGATYTLTADITLHAQWTANTNTAYTVKHYQQNLGDNEYTLFETQNLTGTTDTEVTPAVNNYTGFTAPATQTKTIAADGSMEIAYYYTRNTYTITWVDGNGTTIETDEAVKYGATPAYSGETPTKTATAKYTYTFTGWDKEITAVTEDITYTAQFSSTVNKYHITWLVKLNGETLASKEEDVEYGQTPSYGSTPTKEQTESQVFTFSGWTPEVASVTGDQEYIGSFYVTTRPYTITFVNDNGSELLSSQVGWGSTPTYNGENDPVSSHTGDGYEYTFIGWKPALTTVSGPATYTAVYSRSADAITVDKEETVTNNTSATTTTVVDGGTLTVGTENDDITLQSTTIIVESGGQLEVASEGSIKADVFIIQATTKEIGEEDSREEVQVSGELSETGSKNVQTVYYDLTRQLGAGKFLARVWYAVAVPWAVEVPTNSNGGVYIKQGDNYVQQRLGATFDLITYDGNCRAKQGASADCWVYLEDEIAGGADPVMVPGKLYMIYLTQETSTIRFQKKVGVDYPIHTNSLTVSPYAETTSNEGKDANWNGIANPATYKAYMNVAVGGLVQKFVPGTQPRDGGRYLPIDLDDKQSVGQPFFVQVASTTESTIQVTRTDNPSASAPRRVQAQGEREAHYAISLAANDKLADRLYIQTSEEKEDRYEVGKDMSKMGVSAHVAQMWVDRYDSKLCLNSAILTNNKANYPLGIYAPQAGEYKIFAPADIESGDNIYLTLDDRVIWNLSMGAYYASLEKGTTTRYGLRLVRSNAPSVATGVDEEHSGNTQCTKVIMDDHVYILRNGEMYSIDGQLVK